MSIQVNLNFGGDFEGNARHAEVAKEIMDAVKAVIDRQPDLSYKPTITENDQRTSTESLQADGSYVQRWGYQYSKSLQTVYHVNA